MKCEQDTKVSHKVETRSTVFERANGGEPGFSQAARDVETSPEPVVERDRGSGTKEAL